MSMNYSGVDITLNRGWIEQDGCAIGHRWYVVDCDWLANKAADLFPEYTSLCDFLKRYDCEVEGLTIYFWADKEGQIIAEGEEYL